MENLEKICKQMRIDIIEMIAAAGSGFFAVQPRHGEQDNHKACKINTTDTEIYPKPS